MIFADDSLSASRKYNNRLLAILEGGSPLLPRKGDEYIFPKNVLIPYSSPFLVAPALPHFPISRFEPLRIVNFIAQRRRIQSRSH